MINRPRFLPPLTKVLLPAAALVALALASAAAVLFIIRSGEDPTPPPPYISGQSTNFLNRTQAMTHLRTYLATTLWAETAYVTALEQPTQLQRALQAPVPLHCAEPTGKPNSEQGRFLECARRSATAAPQPPRLALDIRSRQDRSCEPDAQQPLASHRPGGENQTHGTVERRSGPHGRLIDPGAPETVRPLPGGNDLAAEPAGLRNFQPGPRGSLAVPGRRAGGLLRPHVHTAVRNRPPGQAHANTHSRRRKAMTQKVHQRTPDQHEAATKGGPKEQAQP